MIPKKLVIIGFGAVAKSLVMIMLNQKTSFDGLPIVIIECKDIKNSDTYITLCKKKKFGPITYVNEKMIEQNYVELFDKYIAKITDIEQECNAIVIDVAYRIDTLSLVQECQKRKCLYINTAIDEWIHGPGILYDLKEHILNNMKYDNDKHMTAVMNHGMNPGLVSHFVKMLLKCIVKSSDNTNNIQLYKQNKYNEVAKNLGLTLIQIAERDNQVTHLLSNERTFYNTWSVIGLLDEATIKAEISWGTHEQKIPQGADVSKLKDSGQIYLQQMGYQVRAKTFEPEGGQFTGYCIPHAECYSLVDFLSVKNASTNEVIYRPSAYYTYLIPDTAKLICHYVDYCLDNHGLPHEEHVLRSDEIVCGYDSVGCLIHFGKNGKKYWMGSIVDNDSAKKISGEITGTCIQVGIGVLSCMEWMINNPYQGIIEPEDVNTNFVLSYSKKWLGKFCYKDVTDECNQCGITSDQFSDLLKFPTPMLFNTSI